MNKPPNDGSRPRPAFPARLGALAPAERSGAGRNAVNPVTASRPPAVPPGVAPVAGPVAAGRGLDSEAVRAAMVRKLREQGLHNAAVAQAFGAVPRHLFVDSALVTQAYEDTSLPIGLGQTISKPSVVGRMLELLLECPAVVQGRVLEIGTGCGYQAALLGRLCREVYSMERLRALHEKARENLRPLRIPNVHLILGDGTLGYPKGAPYAGILAAAGGEAIPDAWLEQLAVGGRLVAPAVVGGASGERQCLVVVDRTAQGCVQQVLEAVHFVPLKSGIV